MSQHTVNPTPARSWRDIPQSVTPRAMSREGKKRMIMAIGNVVGVVLVLGAAGWGIYEVVGIWEENPTRITAPAKGAPIRDLALRTDGVLDKLWLARTLALPKDISLMELDLVALKARLEESGQVSKAVIERNFTGNTLVVTLQERSPVARVTVRIAGAEPQAFMVARDGTVYSSFGYDPVMTAALPFLDGVKLLRDGSGFEPIEGMEAVADLLGTAHANTPALYASFKIVSLARFAQDRTLIVKSTEADAIIFGLASDGFYKQLARLDYILEEARRQNSPGVLKTINLAIGGNQVPIAFDTPPAPAGSNRSSVKPAAPNGAALFSPLPRNSSSKTKT